MKHKTQLYAAILKLDYFGILQNNVVNELW